MAKKKKRSEFGTGFPEDQRGGWEPPTAPAEKPSRWPPLPKEVPWAPPRPDYKLFIEPDLGGFLATSPDEVLNIHGDTILEVLQKAIATMKEKGYA